MQTSKPSKGISNTTKIVAALIVVILGFGVYYGYQMLAHPIDTIVMGTTDSVQSSIDPSDAYDFFGWEIIQNTGCGLVDIRPGSSAGPSDFVPALATSWSSSADGMSWTFNLRHGVKFSDGTEFTSYAVKYSIQRGMDIANPDGPYVGIGYSDIIGSIDTPDNYTVVFHLKYPFVPFLSLMACPASFIVNPKYAPMQYFRINYTEGNARASSPMDLGPYTLTSWTRVAGKDSEMRLDANPNYWNITGGYPKTKHIIVKFYSDPTALRMAIDAGEIDVAFRQITATDLKSLEAKTNVHVWQGVGAFIQYIVFQESIKPFDNPLVRQAIAAAVNRTAITSTVFLGLSQPLYSMIPNGMAGHQDAFKQLGDANYAFVRTTLAQLGYDENHKLVVDLWYESSGHYASSADIAAVLKSSLEASGVITVNLHGVDWPTYRSNMRANSMPLYILGWYPDYVDPDDYVYPFLDSSGGSWLHDNYASPAMDQLIASSRSETDSAMRNQLYAQVQTKLATDVPMVPLFQSSAWAVSRTVVQGVVLDITQDWRDWLLYKTGG